MVAIPKPKDSGGFRCFNPTEKRMRLHFLSLFPIPYSLFPAPCSLLPAP
ncbi:MULTISPECIES: hypothetical protein [unclassified Moorena]|nr:MULTISPECIES: hypothetical protein [unclassified Moorena]NEO11445.1 hypothetical protein [Moorena sp. SIO3E8]NEP29033.1 hypothetical protein [Moorena sp. SIO3I6]NEP97905.1 hypothetical protein [Moorena sp. SIO3F7]